MNPHTSLFRAVLSVFLLGLAATSFAQNTELQDIVNEVAQDPGNPILAMQREMLRGKHGLPVPSVSRWNQLRSMTNLRRESTAGVTIGRRRNSLGSSAQLLTGQRAIDESLQLGSIGSNRATGDQSDFVSIDDIALVEIASHPWREMTEGRTVPVPEIAKLIPSDLFFVHMINPEKFLQLEDILEQQSDLFGDVYHFGNATRMRGEMAARLGVPDSDALIAAVDEMAFVSDDLSFKPRTDYALVLKLVNAVAEETLKFIVGDQAVHRKVGDYLVIATHENLTERIERAYQDETGSMASAPDYHYALLEMEPQRDGLIYLSETFIRKLTGPAYRINARRRNTILNTLETLQYSVFAYRRLTGRWPSSLREMAAENYIAEETIYEPARYEIDDDGRVSHDTWGSLWNVTPVNQVPLLQIATSEKTLYDRFSAGYQDFFREFFDPIGIAYTVSDQLYLHTLILPLIENNDYRGLQSFFGGDPRLLSLVFDPNRLGAINLAATFSIDDLLASVWGRNFGAGDTDETPAARRERVIHKAESELSEEIFGEPVPPGERLLDFIGDEVFFGVGEKNSFTMSNIADLDVWFGLKLNDRARAEAFFRRLWLRVASEYGGLGGGLFQLSSTEPLSNEYNGQQFYLLPTGFINIFYVFFDDAFYLTVSQLSMNRLIDARQNTASERISAHLQRGFAHIGNTHNIVAAVNLEDVASFELGQEANFWGQQVASQFNAHRSTLSEAITLAKLLPDYDGTLANVATYYSNLPKDFYGAQFEVDAGISYLVAGEKRTAVSEIPARRGGHELNEILKTTLSGEDLRARLRAFRSASLGLSFVPEGLDVKLSVGNPNVTNADPRFTFASTDSGTAAITGTRRTVAIAAIIVFALIALGFIVRRRRASI